MSAPRLLAPTTISGGVPTAGAGTLNTIALWTPDGNTLGNSLLTQAGTTISNNTGAIRATGTTAGAPAFTGADTDTGIYFPAANQMRFSTAGSPAISIDATQQVGIGTASPSYKLAIENSDATAYSSTAQAAAMASVRNTYSAAGNTQAILAHSTANYSSVWNVGLVETGGGAYTGAYIWQNRTGAATWAERARIDSSGNVGIGTTSPWSKLSAVTANGADTVSVGFSFDSANNYRSGISTNWSSVSASGNLMGFLVSNATLTGFTRVMTLNGAGQAAIGTSSFTTDRALTTVADLDVYGVRVGRGTAGISTNTAVGSGTLGAVTTAPNATAVGVNALAALTTGTNNTAVGLGAASAVTTSYNNTAIGVSALGAATSNAGFQNVAVGVSALAAATSAKNNVAIGVNAGSALTSGSSNIIIGSGASVAAVTDSNQLVLGDATNYIATNGGATTYYATAGASLGYIQVRLNGANVKIQVFAP